MNAVKTLMSVTAMGMAAWFLWDTTRRARLRQRERVRAEGKRFAAQSWEGEGGALMSQSVAPAGISLHVPTHTREALGLDKSQT
jgi:hypothetical protein